MSLGNPGGVVGHLPPAKAEAQENESGGSGLESDELGHEPLGSTQFLLEIA